MATRGGSRTPAASPKKNNVRSGKARVVAAPSSGVTITGTSDVAVDVGTSSNILASLDTKDCSVTVLLTTGHVIELSGIQSWQVQGGALTVQTAQIEQSQPHNMKIRGEGILIIPLWRMTSARVYTTEEEAD